MKVYFLSDLHLSSGNDEASLRFESFLRNIPGPGDLVILGGDIFDLFVGNKRVFREKYSGILTAIRELGARGAEVYFLEGNHDFHVDSVFTGQKGVEVRSGDFSLMAQQRKIWVSHGDLIDPEDKGYRLLRKITRHPLFRLLLRILPGAWIEAIGRLSSKESRKYNHEGRGGEANQARLRSLYLDFARSRIAEGAGHVLVGHSHLKDQVLVETGGRRGEYLNLGFSSETLVYACLEEGAGQFSILSYRGKRDPIPLNNIAIESEEPPPFNRSWDRGII